LQLLLDLTLALQQRNLGGGVRARHADEDEMGHAGGADGIDEVMAVAHVSGRPGGVGRSGGEHGVDTPGRRLDGANVVEIHSNKLHPSCLQGTGVATRRITRRGTDLMPRVAQGGHQR
jgi:hypothetical protein